MTIKSHFTSTVLNLPYYHAYFDVFYCKSDKLVITLDTKNNSIILQFFEIKYVIYIQMGKTKKRNAKAFTKNQTKVKDKDNLVKNKRRFSRKYMIISQKNFHAYQDLQHRQMVFLYK